MCSSDLDALRIGEPLAVDADLLPPWIDACAELCHDRAVDLDASGGDQFLAGTTAAEADGCKHLLESLEAVVLHAADEGCAAAGSRCHLPGATR